MKFLEKNLLNTHYYIPSDSSLKLVHNVHYTITPDVIKKLLSGQNTIYFTDENKWLIQIEYNENVENKYVKLYSYVMFDDYDFLLTGKEDWFKNFWDKPFMITNPIYEFDNKLYIFSNKFIKPIVINPQENLMNQIIENGAFSIGNGIIMALSLVALKEMRENDFIDAINKIPKTKLIHLLPDKWTHYFYYNPIHILDHIFKYAFVNNSERLYKYIFCITNEYPNFYNIEQRCMSTIFSLVKRKDQIRFSKIYINKYTTYPYTIIVDLYNLFKLKDFDYIKTILIITKTKLSNILYVLNDISLKKRYKRTLWRFLLKLFGNDWIPIIERYLLTQLNSFQLKNKRLPFIPMRHMKDFIHMTSFKYNGEWKSIFNMVHQMIKSPNYNRIFEKKAIKRLHVLNQLTLQHFDGHIVNFVVKDFLKDNKELLFT